MKKTFKKIIITLLTLSLLIGGLGSSVLAEEALPDATSKRVLNLYKYVPTHQNDKAGDGTQQTIEGRKPLPGVEFKLWKVTGIKPAGQSPTEAEITGITTGTLTDTLITDVNGNAKHNFGVGTTNDGLYLVVETPNDKLEAPTTPFYLNVPLTHPNGSELLYDMYVYPKGDFKGAPTVEKDTGALGNKENGHHIGKVFNYIIRGSVPEKIQNAILYTFTDVLDRKLNYEGRLAVTLLKKDNTKIPLVNTTHYTTTGTSNLHAVGGTIAMQLTTEGMQYIGDNLRTGSTVPEIQLSFDASINSSATMGGEIPNNVILNFTNSKGSVFESQVATKPVVYTGGFKLQKFDKNNQLITETSAIFQIATSEEKAKSGTYLKRTTFASGETAKILDVDDTGYNTAQALTFETQNGQAELKGLAYDKPTGTPYWLVETKAPDGYNLLTKPSKITITADSYNDVNIIRVVNTKGFTLPATGSIGSIFSIFLGLALIVVAIVLLIIQRRKKQHLG